MCSIGAFFIFTGLLIGLYIFWESFAISRPGGVLAPDEPYQREVLGEFPFEKNGFRITPLATFDIRARVIAAARYRFGHDADLAPVDLVLGWGAMSDSDVLKKISFSQGGRAYAWMTSTYSVSRRVIETHSANMHMIPADGEIERQLKSIRPGNMVHLQGFLSSRSRARKAGAGKVLLPAMTPAAAPASSYWFDRSMFGKPPLLLHSNSTGLSFVLGVIGA